MQYENLIPRTVDSAWEVESSINWALSNIDITMLRLVYV